MPVKNQRFEIHDAPKPQMRKRASLAPVFFFAFLAVLGALAYFYFTG